MGKYAVFVGDVVYMPNDVVMYDTLQEAKDYALWFRKVYDSPKWEIETSLKNIKAKNLGAIVYASSHSEKIIIKKL